MQMVLFTSENEVLVSEQPEDLSLEVYNKKEGCIVVRLYVRSYCGNAPACYNLATVKTKYAAINLIEMLSKEISHARTSPHSGIVNLDNITFRH